MSEELNERNRTILEAIIEDHIGSAEPVGSKALAGRRNIGLSPATVRNAMAELEECGYIVSPHTSAGRVPTDKGYRYYVDRLLQVGSLSPQAKRSLEEHSVRKDLRVEDLLRHAGQALSSLSRQTGLVLAPQFNRTIFRQIEFVKLSGPRVLVILVSKSGLVQNRVVEVQEEVSQGDLDQAANYLNDTLAGLTVSEARLRIAEKMVEEKALYDALAQRAISLSRLAFDDEFGGQVFVEGASRLFDQPEFSDMDQMKRLLRTFEQKSLLVELLDKSQRVEGVQVVIGQETECADIEGCTLITANYSGQKGKPGASGTIGVIGPVRMPYSQVIPLVDYTAQLISQMLQADHD